jgi:hypothetical protein
MSIYPQPTLSSFVPGIVKEKATKPVNIASISAPAFSLNIYCQGNIIFTISLYKINRLLESYKEDKEDLS